MRKTIYFALFIIIMFSFGCSVKKQKIEYNMEESYLIFEEDDNVYIRIKNNSTSNNSNQFGDLEFDSVEDFLYKIQNGFNKDELEVINSFEKDSDGKIQIIDYNKLYYPNIEGFEVKSFYWNGVNYSYYLESSNGIWGYLHVNDSERFNTEYDKWYKNYINDKGDDVISHEKDAITNGDVYIYKTSSGVLKFIQYDVQEDNCIKNVGERYAISLDHDLMECNEYIPYRVNVYICDYNCYFEFFNLSEDFRDIVINGNIMLYNSINN